METTNTNQCAWIGGGEGCTHSALEHYSYCVQHYPLIYKVGTAVRRKKDARRAQQVWDIESLMNEAVQQLVEEGYDFDEPRWEPEVVKD